MKSEERRVIKYLSMLKNSSLFTLHSSLIIGAGASGLSAGLWCDELGLQSVVLESAAEIGGQLRRVYNPILNHLGGAETVDGAAMCRILAAQIEKRKFELRFQIDIAAIDLRSKTVTLTDGAKLTARAIILATGVRRRRLNVPGESEFVGRGILESGKRDAPLVAGKTVCIVGGGDAAAENALILAAQAAQVHLIHRRAELSARREFVDKIEQTANIEFLPETRVTRILGDAKVSGVELQTNQSVFQIQTDAVLLRLGVEPNTDLFKNQLESNAQGYVSVNHLHETKIENVFAIGDLSNPLAPTLSGAIGAGATVAKVLAARFQ